jgi:NAD(P)-dependent dehydrogenase (short-subunit alcohol dehydrogenase family)
LGFRRFFPFECEGIGSGGFVANNLGRPGTPDDIGQMAVAVLLGRFDRYVTGTTVEVDGGLGLMSWIPAKA